MEELTQRADDHPGLSSFVSFFSRTFTDCVDSFNTCFSSDADKRCVLLGLCLSSVAALLLSCLVLMQWRCRSGGTPGESCVFSYCFLGDLCSTVGAILSKQLYMQVLMGVIAGVLDAVNVLSCYFSVCRNSKKTLRVRMMRRRRRQHLLAVCVLMVVAGGFLKSLVKPSDTLHSGRRLLYAALQDQTEVLGYVLGLISFVIVCTARFPALCRTEGEKLTKADCISRLLCSLAGSLYSAAILLYDTPQSGFLLRVMPWLLSAICSSILDVLIVVFHFCRRETRQEPVRFSSDTRRLLGSCDVPAVDNYFMNITKGKGKSRAETKEKKLAKMTEMGQYIDVTLHPVCCLHEVSLSQEEAEDKPRDGTTSVMTVNNSYYSDLSSDSSSVSTDLEWDFEEANGKWRELSTTTRGEFVPHQAASNPGDM
ncbi:transmembrane protein 44 isoform X2 [Cynoglossus semilaevis]|uniref:Transmembrane protein 44 n=1 Tax=Cynoglossus semilaevis TaxID=244447 RepID=A0A3P8WD12_CYNSE|nr:transmembrane protein 44 isoform X2 [Cynoglossus semilaevis]